MAAVTPMAAAGARHRQTVCHAIEDIFSILDAAPWSPKNRTRQGQDSEEVEIVGFRATQKKVVTAWNVQELLDEGIAGDNVGLLLRGTERTMSSAGRWSASGSITPHTKFKAEAYVLTKEEGTAQPFFSGYRPQFYFRTTDVTGDMKLPQGGKWSCGRQREL